MVSGPSVGQVSRENPSVSRMEGGGRPPAKSVMHASAAASKKGRAAKTAKSVMSAVGKSKAGPSVRSKAGPAPTPYAWGAVNVETSVDKEKFRRLALAKHNELRGRHGVGALSLSDALCFSAQSWAESMASKLKLTHSPAYLTERRLGENLYWSRVFKGTEAEAAATVKSFYDEAASYDYAHPGKSSKKGKPIAHFAQLVWRRCYEVGFGAALSRKGELFAVAHYDPPGNCVDGYEDNVFPIGSRPPPRPDPCIEVPDLVTARHNLYRSRHGSPPLVVNSLLNEKAAEKATAMAKAQNFAYPPGCPYGLNIGLANEFNPVATVDQWYRQGDGVAPGSPLRPAYTNFSQLLWAGSQRVGVGLGLGRPWSVLLVIYDPKGNFPSAFAANVHILPPHHPASTPSPPSPSHP